MGFVIFLFVLWGAGLFHRQEHRDFVLEMKRLAGVLRDTGALPGKADWRIVKKEGSTLYLRRAFRVADRKDKLRYFLPIVFLFVIMAGMQSWKFSLVYGGFIVAKWFLSVTVLDPVKSRYDVTLLGQPLFGEEV